MKKLLALVLALVMTLGLATVGANAATVPSYSDSKDITYKEAVDVVGALGIMLGDEANGAAQFRPTDTLKRSEGAKIIAYLLVGQRNADSYVATGTKYTDLPASHWAAGYMEYLTAEGVMGGLGDGRIDPDGSLTATAFAKMLLTALGYDAVIEGMGGPDWAIFTQKLAKQVKIFDGNNNVVGSNAVTRQEAALYVLNTIKAPLVEYENKGSSMTVNGATINFGAGKATYKTNTGKSTNRYSQIDDKYLNGQTVNGVVVNSGAQIIEFGEEYYDKLVLNNHAGPDKGADDFMRISNKWVNDGKEIGNYPKTPDLVYTDVVTLSQLYKDLGLTDDTPLTRDGKKLAHNSSTYMGDDGSLHGTLNNNVNYFHDGVAYNMESGKPEGPGTFDRTGDNVMVVKKDSSVKIGGPGTETYVYYVEGIIRVCEVNWYVGDVTGVYAATASKQPYIDITGRGNLGIANTKETTDYKVDDVVLFTASWLNKNENNDLSLGKVASEVSIKDVQKAEIVEGEMTGFVEAGVDGWNSFSTGSVTISGTKYTYSAKVANTPEGSFLKNSTKLKIVLDKYGNAIDVGDYGVQNYAVVTKAAKGGNYHDDPLVELRLATGEGTGAVKLNDKNNPWNSSTTKDYSTYDGTTQITAGDIVTYTVNSDNKYSLTLRSKARILDAADNDLIIDNNSSSLSTIFTKAKANDATYANSGKSLAEDSKITNSNAQFANGKTVFVIKDPNGDWKVFTGIKEVPTIRSSGAQKIEVNAYAAVKGEFSSIRVNDAGARIVYVNIDGKGTMSNNESIFVKYDPAVGASRDGGDVYYAFEAYVNGEKQTLKVEEDVGEALKKAYGKSIGYELYKSMTKNSKDIAKLSQAQGSVTGSIAPNKGVVGLGNMSYPYASDVKVFYINENNEISSVSVNSIPDTTKANARNTVVWFSLNNAREANFIFWKYVTTKTYSAGNVPSNYELETELTDNTIINIKTDYTVSNELAVPAGHKLEVTGKLIVKKDATLTLGGEIVASKLIQVNGDVVIESTGKLTGDAIDIQDNGDGTSGHVEAAGFIHTDNTTIKGNTIAGSSLVATTGADILLKGATTVKGSLTISGGEVTLGGTIVEDGAKIAISGTTSEVVLGGVTVNVSSTDEDKQPTITISGGKSIEIGNVTAADSNQGKVEIKPDDSLDDTAKEKLAEIVEIGYVDGSAATVDIEADATYGAQVTVNLSANLEIKAGKKAGVYVVEDDTLVKVIKLDGENTELTSTAVGEVKKGTGKNYNVLEDGDTVTVTVKVTGDVKDLSDDKAAWTVADTANTTINSVKLNTEEKDGEKTTTGAEVSLTQKIVETKQAAATDATK